MSDITTPSGTVYQHLDPTTLTVRVQKSISDGLYALEQANLATGPKAADGPRTFDLDQHEIVYANTLVGWVTGTLDDLSSADEAALWAECKDDWAKITGAYKPETEAAVPLASGATSQPDAAPATPSGTPDDTPTEALAPTSAA